MREQLIDTHLISSFSLGLGLNAPFGGLSWGIGPGERTLTSVILERRAHLSKLPN